MKKLAVALGVLLMLLGIMAFNVWRAEHEAIARKPTVVELDRAALHAQLVQAEQREAEIEKMYWNSPARLRILIQSHQQRIDQLAGNPAGGEIIAHDQNAIARLQKRINDLEAYFAAQAEAQAEAAEQDAQEEQSNPNSQN